MKKLYAEISKTEKQDDGTIKVWGYASTEAVDSDGETITADAMKAALPDYMKFGAVREMHQNIAAGTAISAEVDDTGKTNFGAHIVDPLAVEKVQTGVYKGFSIGGKVLGRDDLDKSIIKSIKLVEVSLVDRPANPEAVFTCYKAEDVEKGEEGGIVDLKKEGLKIVTTPSGQNLLMKDAQGEPLKKGMYNVSSLASVLSSISWITSDEEWEKQYEGDSSPIPQQLRDWLAAGCQIFLSMAAEETAEMIANLQAMAPDPDPDPLQMSATAAADLQKVGAKFSQKSMGHIDDLKAALEAAQGHVEALLSSETDDGDVEDAAAIEGLKKAASDALQKEKESLEKLTKLEAENEDLVKRIKELEAQPAPGKGVKMVVVGKDDDVGKSEQISKEEYEKMSPEERAYHEFKKMYQGR